MFTIEVEKRGKDERFSFDEVRKNAKVFHDCFGGKVLADWIDWYIQPNAYKEYKGWKFICVRCESERRIKERKIEKIKNKIIEVVIDGRERKIDNDVRVIQKTK